MKSPTSSVGIIEPDGILNGSARNERNTRISSSTGKNERAYSVTIGSRSASSARVFRSAAGSEDMFSSAAARFFRPGASRRRSASQSTPVTPVRMTSSRAKSKSIFSPSGKRRTARSELGSRDASSRFPVASAAFPAPSFVCLQHGEERFLRDLDAPDLFHALLAFFLLLEQLALARHVAAVALREYVLAQRLDRRARDDLRADRGLDRDIELLARNEILHALDELAAATFGGITMHDEAQRV